MTPTLRRRLRMLIRAAHLRALTLAVADYLGGTAR
jgi:hypothetical protein